MRLRPGGAGGRSAMRAVFSAKRTVFVLGLTAALTQGTGPSGAQEPALETPASAETPVEIREVGQAEGTGRAEDPAPIETAGESSSEPSPAAAIDPGETFVLANAAYEEGEAQKAVDLYEAMLAVGTESGQLHYNLGNAYLRNGQLGQAIASYRRSQGFLPRNEDIRANLAFARRSAKDAIAPPAPSAAISTLLFWHFGLSRSELAATVLVLNLLFWGVLALRLFRRGSEILRWLTFGILLLLLAAGGSLAAHYFFPSKVAVIIPQEVGAHNGPSAEAVVRFKLHAGTEVAVRDQRDDWLRVALPDGQQGWIRGDWAEVVER